MKKIVVSIIGIILLGVIFAVLITLSASVWPSKSPYDLSEFTNAALPIVWNSIQENASADYYNNNYERFPIHGMMRKGVLILSTHNAFVLENKKFLKTNNWQNDSIVSSGGASGITWGYSKQIVRNRQTIIYSYIDTSMQGVRISPEPCPCTYNIRIFISEPFAYPSTNKIY